MQPDDKLLPESQTEDEQFEQERAKLIAESAHNHSLKDVSMLVQEEVKNRGKTGQRTMKGDDIVNKIDDASSKPKATPSSSGLTPKDILARRKAEQDHAKEVDDSSSNDEEEDELPEEKKKAPDAKANGNGNIHASKESKKTQPTKKTNSSSVDDDDISSDEEDEDQHPKKKAIATPQKKNDPTPTPTKQGDKSSDSSSKKKQAEEAPRTKKTSKQEQEDSSSSEEEEDQKKKAANKKRSRGDDSDSESEAEEKNHKKKQEAPQKKPKQSAEIPIPTMGRQDIDTSSKNSWERAKMIKAKAEQEEKQAREERERLIEEENNKKKRKHAEEDTESDDEKGSTKSKSKKKSTKANESDEEEEAPKKKKGTKAKTDDSDEEEDTPKKKDAGKKKKPDEEPKASPKKKKPSKEDDSDDEEEDVKSKKKTKPSAPPQKKTSPKNKNDEEEDEEDIRNYTLEIKNPATSRFTEKPLSKSYQKGQLSTLFKEYFRQMAAHTFNSSYLDRVKSDKKRIEEQDGRRGDDNEAHVVLSEIETFDDSNFLLLSEVRKKVSKQYPKITELFNKLNVAISCKVELVKDQNKDSMDKCFISEKKLNQSNARLVIIQYDQRPYFNTDKKCPAPVKVYVSKDFSTILYDYFNIACVKGLIAAYCLNWWMEKGGSKFDGTQLEGMIQKIMEEKPVNKNVYYGCAKKYKKGIARLNGLLFNK